MSSKKGTTIVEIIVSLALISIVLIFLMKLFINARGVASTSKIDLDYEILVANIIKAVGKDIEKYSVYEVKRLDDSSVRIIYNEYRPTKLTERISKVLKIYENNNAKFISYSYDSENLTSQERSEAVIRELPKNCILNEDTEVFLIPSKDSFQAQEEIFEIKIPLRTMNDLVYDINIYGIIER